MTRSRVACSLALAAFGLGAGAALGLGVPAASAQNVRTMGSVVQEPVTKPAEMTTPEAEPKSSRPAPNEPREAPPSSVAPTVTVLFGSNSADISDAGKAALDRVAKTISQQRMAQVELRAFAGGADPADVRRVALARALAVRSYLIDQGVTARIEVGAFAASRGAGERVDVLAPGP
jgi:outer membrane protein OmpA-like peptidoglycan-associated protein